MTGEEQWLFRQLAVFFGGFDLETAETIMAGLAGCALDVLTALSALVDQSLIQVKRRGEERVRYTMLESIREYVCEQLDWHGELDAAERGHTRYFLELAERADPHLRMHGQRLWYFCLEQEHDNFRTALRWLLDHDEQEAALRLASALGYFWWIRGHHGEGWRWLEEALSRAPDVDPAVRTRALLSAGLLLTYEGDFDRSRVVLEEALRLAQQRQEVLRLVAEGLTSKAIGRHLFLSPSTVNYHLSSIFRKLGAETQAQAVAMAARRGLL